MLKRIPVLALIWVLVGGTAQAAPRSYQVGIYVTSIYDIDYVHQTFAADFWLWTLSDSTIKSPIEQVEFPSAKSLSVSHLSYENRGSKIWGAAYYRATFLHAWNTEDFPFDKQRISIYVEDADGDATQIILTADTANTKISSELKLPGWKLGAISSSPRLHTYETTYGDPDLKGSSTYSGVDFSLPIRRSGVGLFFKLFSGAYISFAIAMMVFLFKPVSDNRYSLAVGALFAALANKYIIDSSLPPTVSFTLVDKIHVTTWIFILLIILLSGTAHWLIDKEKVKDDTLLDKIGKWVILATYIILNFAFVITTAA